jgi:hypothetical protein
MIPDTLNNYIGCTRRVSYLEYYRSAAHTQMVLIDGTMGSPGFVSFDSKSSGIDSSRLTSSNRPVCEDK